MSISFTLELHDGEDWVEIPAQAYSISDTSRNPVTELRVQIKSVALSEAQLALLTLERRAQCTHVVDGTDLSFLGRIKVLPKSLLRGTLVTYDITIYGESYEATRFRFLDSWPKAGVATWSEIVQDAWERYGPAGITFVGLDTNSTEPDYIVNPYETLFQFMEEVSQRTAWRWKVIDSDLQFYDPVGRESAIEIATADLRPGSLITTEMPDVANVVFIPATFTEADFVDTQITIANQAQYFMQYSAEEKPVIEVNSVAIDPADIAEDGSYEAAAAKVVWSKVDRFIRFAVGEIPAGGLSLEITYDVHLPVVVRRANQDSIVLYDGEYQHIIRRDPRPTREEAVEIGDAYLAEHAFPVASLQAELLEKRVQVDYYYQVDIPSQSISQLMPITEVSRNWDGRFYSVKATFAKTPITDKEMMFDFFRRLERVEAQITAS
ncbi:MAG: hypothetical protein KKD77_20085, partial [Gammaproteobacteria bacterium]|nr:hypothetical protein [Gammaproteobacteria bacterium]